MRTVEEFDFDPVPGLKNINLGHEPIYLASVYVRIIYLEYGPASAGHIPRVPAELGCAV
jgi:hypothetical protein